MILLCCFDFDASHIVTPRVWNGDWELRNPLGRTFFREWRPGSKANGR